MVLRPDWSRTVAARRVAASALVVLAAAAALRSDPDGEHLAIVVAARDLAPGVELTAADLTVENRLAESIPDGSQSELGAVTGARLAGPMRRGEAITDVRLLGPRLAESAAGPDARIVPLHLADGALVDLIRPGDVVDVLAADMPGGSPTSGVNSPRPQLLAGHAVVVLVSEKPNGPGADGDNRVVLVALPSHTAIEVAGATLTRAVTLTFH